MKNIKLSEKELSEILGGNQTSLISSNDEIKNINEYKKCSCDYVNRSSLINKNSVDACACNCV